MIHVMYKSLILHGIVVALKKHLDKQCESVYIFNTKAIITHIKQNNIIHHTIMYL